jgi:hypothetical protein
MGLKLQLRRVIEAAYREGWNRAAADGRPHEIPGARDLGAKRYADKHLGPDSEEKT